MKPAKTVYSLIYGVLIVCSIGLAISADWLLLDTLHISSSADHHSLFSYALFAVTFGITVPVIHLLLPKPGQWKWWVKAVYWISAGLLVLILTHIALEAWIEPDGEQNTGNERIQYEYLSAYIEGLASGEFEIAPAAGQSTVDRPPGLDISTGTSLALLGLRLKQSDSSRLMIGKNLRFDSESIAPADYAKFLDINDVMKTRYQRYHVFSKEYFHQNSTAPDDAANLWQSITTDLDNHWNNFTEKKAQLRQLVKDKTNTFIPIFKFYLRLRADCQQSSSCLDQAEKHYLSRIVNGLSLPKEPRYWCDKKDRTAGEVFWDLLSGIGLSSNFENRLVLLDEHYSCPNTRQHVSDRILAIHKAEFNRTVGTDFRFEKKSDYLSSQKANDFVRNMAEKSGVKLSAEWTLDQEKLFLEQALQAMKLAAEVKYNRAIKRIAGGHIEPGLSFIDFSRAPLVAEAVLEELDLPVGDTINLGRELEVKIPTILSPYYVGLADELFAQASFSRTDQTVGEQNNNWRANAMTRPTLVMATTLVAVFNIVFLLVFILNQFFTITKVSSILSGAGLAMAAFIVPLFTRPVVTTSPFYRYLMDDFFSWTTGLMHAWFVHIEPIIFAFGNIFSSGS